MSILKKQINMVFKIVLWKNIYSIFPLKKEIKNLNKNWLKM